MAGTKTKPAATARVMKPVNATDEEMELSRQKKFQNFHSQFQGDGPASEEEAEEAVNQDEDGDAQEEEAIEGGQEAAQEEAGEQAAPKKAGPKSKPAAQRKGKPITTSKNIDKLRRKIQDDEWLGLIYIDEEREKNAWIEEPVPPGSGSTGGVIVRDYCEALGITEDEHQLITV